MVWPWFSAEKKEGERVAVAGFVRRVVAAAMGCFFGCFRIKDSHSHLISNPDEGTSESKTALCSLFLSDDGSPGKREDPNAQQEELDFRELEKEAKFLKACGTLLDTPVEIRNASHRRGDISVQDEDKPSNFSRLPDASIEKLKLEKQPDGSQTPVKICEEYVIGASSLVATPQSCMTDGDDTRRDSMSFSSDTQNVITLTEVPENGTHSAVSSVSPEEFTKSVARKTKSVRFDCESDRSESSESSSEHTKQYGSANYSVSKASPFPTPLKLTDEMQTPGTVFPSYLQNVAGDRTVRIRSQYVYSVSNPVEYDAIEWKEFNDENSDSNILKGSLNKPNDESLSVGKDMEDDLVEQYPADGNIHFGRTPGDRPILGTVATHWHGEKTPHTSVKWWDGNGIPNSTTKYKEDQKVNWHATPFEERLEKALSEETCIPQRKPIGGMPLVELDESEESDTAFSELKSAHPESVVSF